jgi:hypothetical protein
MGGHALRGVVTAWLALIVLQAAGTQNGSGRVAGLFTDINGLVKRALDPKVAAIPDRRNGATTAAPPPDPGARLPDGSWPTYNVPAPGHQNWPSFNVPVPSN